MLFLPSFRNMLYNYIKEHCFNTNISIFQDINLEQNLELVLRGGFF